MKKLLKAVYILSVLFWGAFLLYGITILFAFNYFGCHYSFACKNANNYLITKEANQNLKITYTYTSVSKEYQNVERISSDLFYSKVMKGAPLLICYNEAYPNLSYIKEVNLSVSREKTTVVISFFFIALISVLYTFAKRDYWIKKYEDFFKKLS